MSNRKSNSKTRTGCMTCRVRRIKCDEGKPACTRCLSTGRTCDGYETVFRNSTSSPTQATRAGSGSFLSLYRPGTAGPTENEVETVAHFFKMKNRGSDINYHAEAKATLTAFSDLAVRHALLSLDALSTVFETHGYIAVTPNITKHAGVERGLEEYNKAVSILSSRDVGEPSLAFTRSSLICCELFVAIEVRLGDFTLAVQHFVRGLHIVRQSGSRPSVDVKGCLVPGSHDDLPLLDVLVLKLFMSANPIAWQMERPRADITPDTPDYTSLRSQARLELAALSTNVASFLCHVTGLRHQHQVQGLLEWKANILRALERWQEAYAEPIKGVMGSSVLPIRLRYAIAFCPFLYEILKIVTTLAMGDGTESLDMLAVDFENLDSIASYLTRTRKEIADAINKQTTSKT